FFFFFSSRRRHTRSYGDWSSDVCSSDLLQYVPYRGTGPAMNDLVAGQIDMIVDQTSNSIQQVRAGNIRAYAITDAKRVESAADIDRKSTRLNSSHRTNSYAVFCLKNKLS